MTRELWTLELIGVPEKDGGGCKMNAGGTGRFHPRCRESLSRSWGPKALLAGRTTSRATSASAAHAHCRADGEPIRGHVDLDAPGIFDQILIDDKSIAFDRVHTVGIPLLIQSKSKLWTASAGGHVHADRRAVLALKIAVQLLLRGRCQFKHCNLQSEIVRQVDYN
jgi:hypothetical protein